MEPHLALVAALLAAYLIPEPLRACIDARRGAIAAELRAGEARGVPPALLLAVAFQESHVGCAPRSLGGWGVPGGTPAQAAASLATGRRACGSWRAALANFRCGDCRCPPGRRGYVARVLGVAAALDARARGQATRAPGLQAAAMTRAVQRSRDGAQRASPR